MKLVILAAGKGERLRPLTETRPKPLLPILGEPLICRHVKTLSNLLSPEEIIVVTSYMKDAIEKGLSSCAPANQLKVKLIDQGGELGTGHAIKTAMEYGGAGKYLIVYGDLFLSDSAYKALASMAPYSALVTEVKEPWNYGVARLDGDVIKEVVEKPPRDKAFSNLVYSGALAVDYDFLKYLQDLRPSPRGELEVTDAINAAASRLDIKAVKVSSDEWLDIGRPWEYLLANRRALKEVKGQVILGDVHPTAVIEGPVVISEGAEVGPFVVIEGPAFIGKGAKVGPSSHIRPETVILENAKVGYAVEVKASILMEEARAPHFNYVGDSIIGEDVNLGAGTITANLRFDHKNVKMKVKNDLVDTGLPKLGTVMGGHSQTGINVSIMPGVKIGSYAIIYPGCTVYRDVGSKEVYRCSQ